VIRTATNTTIARAVTGTANEIGVTNGDGVSGNPTIALAAPSPAPTPGSYTSANITVDGLGRVTAAANGSGGGFPDPSGTGIVVKNGTGPTTAITRTITGTANEITVTDGNGVSGNPTLSLGSSASAGNRFPFIVTTAKGLVANDNVSAVLTAPPTTGWSWLNQGTAEVLEETNRITVKGVAESSYTMRGRVRTQALGAGYTLNALVQPCLYSNGLPICALAVRNSTSGRIGGIWIITDNNDMFIVARVYDAGSFVTSLSSLFLPCSNFYPIRIRYTLDTTTMTMELSNSGIDFASACTIPLGTMTFATNLSGDPDQIFLGGNANSSNATPSISLYSYLLS
jgi:hypothetical protein